MNNDKTYETEKRLNIAYSELAKYKENVIGFILAGSVAYSPYENVTKNSDLDLLIVVKNLKDYIGHFSKQKEEVNKLKNRFFEGYCFKETIDEVPVSYHLLSEDAFDIICKCFVADIRVFRPKSKEEEYSLYGFERNHYPYWIKNINLGEFESGVRTIVPIGFINSDRYYLGIHRDKLLSSPQILYEINGKITEGIDKLWTNITHNLCDESFRLYGKLDLDKMNVLNMLAKKDKMSMAVVNAIIETTKQYVEMHMKTRV